LCDRSVGKIKGAVTALKKEFAFFVYTDLY